MDPAVDRPSLALVIPAYNEVRTISRILEKVAALPFVTEVIIVDDGSTDGTRELLRSLPLPARPAVRVCYQPENRGKGAALRVGFERVSSDIVAVQDADLEMEPADLEPLYRLVAWGGTDVAYGSRFLAPRRHRVSLSFLANKVLTMLTSAVIGQRLTDMETCYKMFRRSVLRRVRLRSDRFGFEPEVTIKLARRGYRIRELPVRYVPRREGKKINWKDGLGAIWHILVFRFRDKL